MQSSSQSQEIIELTELVEPAPTQDTLDTSSYKPENILLPNGEKIQHNHPTVQNSFSNELSSLQQSDILKEQSSEIPGSPSNTTLHPNDSTFQNTHTPQQRDTKIVNDILGKLDNLDAIIKPALQPNTPQDTSLLETIQTSLQAIQQQYEVLQADVSSCISSVQKNADHTFLFESKLVKMQSHINTLEAQLENYTTFAKRINELEIAVQRLSVQVKPTAEVMESTESLATFKELFAILEQRCVLIEQKIENMPTIPSTESLMAELLPKLTLSLQPTIEHGALLAASQIIKEELQSLLAEDM